MSANESVPDDPRLTAYALGELSPAEAREIERLLEANVALRDVVAEIRELAGALQAELQREPALELSAGQREAVVAAARDAHGAARRVVCDEVRGTDYQSVRECNREPHAQLNRETARIGNPGYVTTSLSPARRRVGWIAALATVAALLVVALTLFAPTRTEQLVAVDNGLPMGQEFDSDGHPEHLGWGYGTAARAASPEHGEMEHAEETAPQLVASLARQSSPGVVGESRMTFPIGVPRFGASMPAPDQGTGKSTPTTSYERRASGYSLFDFTRHENNQGAGSDVVARRPPRPQPHPAYTVLGDATINTAETRELRRLHVGIEEEFIDGQSLRVERLSEALKLAESQLSFQAPAVSSPSTETYTPIVENPFVAPLTEPLSTFGVDVDTASYTNVRRFLTHGQLPPRDAVRLEELVNYFRYDFEPAPDNYLAANEGRPFAVRVEAAACPWRPDHKLVRVALKGREIARDKRPPSNLVFLVDVSGSMAADNKLPLVKAGLTLLTRQMAEGDKVAIVTYSDTATMRLDSTDGTHRQPIFDCINSLQAQGSTNGAAGIQLAYQIAVKHFLEQGVNRVILCTDGDFNVGVTGDDELVKLIEEQARSRVFFSVFGFGMGNLQDGKLEKLADKGNGHYAYVDGPRESNRVFVDELAGTLVTIAKDVKVQVEFNPARVGAYRLIGYENRALPAPDFDNDKKDAGEIGAGHSVTALYEVVPVGQAPQGPAGATLRYQRAAAGAQGNNAHELLNVRLRYKLPEGDTSSLVELPLVDPASADVRLPGKSATRPSRDFEWAAAVAAFGMVLRESQFRGQAGLDLVLELARGAIGDDPTGQRQELIALVQLAKALRPELARGSPANE
ncbi:MAG: YfbK domain-containing protein [Planctomycetaceae bacterium]